MSKDRVLRMIQTYWPKHGKPSTINHQPSTDRFAGEHEFITWSGGFSYAIPVGSQHPEEAWEFIKWMVSPEATLIECRAQKAYNLSKDRPYVPRIAANIRTNEATFEAAAVRAERRPVGRRP